MLKGKFNGIRNCKYSECKILRKPIFRAINWQKKAEVTTVNWENFMMLYFLLIRLCKNLKLLPHFTNEYFNQNVKCFGYFIWC